MKYFYRVFKSLIVEKMGVELVSDENTEKMNHALAFLSQITNDNSVPRNIRRAATEAVEILEKGEGTPAMKASNAISTLDEISQDPNCPLYARTKLWNIVSILETVRD